MSSLTFTENLRAGSEEVGRQEKTGKKKACQKMLKIYSVIAFLLGEEV